MIVKLVPKSICWLLGWDLDGEITASDSVEGESERFGENLDITADGDYAYAIVGNPRKGTAYVYSRSIGNQKRPFQQRFLLHNIFFSESGAWSEVAKLKKEELKFAFSVSITQHLAAVSSPRDNNQNGAIYLYKRDGDGNWEELQSVMANDGVSKDELGFAVAIDEVIY